MITDADPRTKEIVNEIDKYKKPEPKNPDKWPACRELLDDFEKKLGE